MVRQVGWVQLEQSDMRLALNMGKIAKEGFLRVTIEGKQQLIKIPRMEVREGKKWGNEFPGHEKVKAAIERHLAMVYKNQMDCYLPCQNGTAKNPHTCWRCKQTSAPLPELAAPPPGRPPLPGLPPAPPGDADGNEYHERQGMPSRCVYIHSPHPNTQFFNHNIYTKNSKRN